MKVVVPQIPIGQVLGCREFEMQNPSALRRSFDRTIAAMADQWPHQKCVSPLAENSDGRPILITAMRTRNQFEWAIGIRQVVKMQAQREHLFEQLAWRFDMGDADFRCRFGKSEAWQAIVAYCNRAILVPGQRPGMIRRLVEE